MTIKETGIKHLVSNKESWLKINMTHNHNVSGNAYTVHFEWRVKFFIDNIILSTYKFEQKNIQSSEIIVCQYTMEVREKLVAHDNIRSIQLKVTFNLVDLEAHSLSPKRCHTTETPILKHWACLFHGTVRRSQRASQSPNNKGTVLASVQSRPTVLQHLWTYKSPEKYDSKLIGDGLCNNTDSKDSL